MVRNGFAILMAPVVWGALALPGNQLVFLAYPEALAGQTPLGYLVLALVISLVYSFVSGAISGWIAKPDFTRIGPLAGLALLVVGVIAQVTYWDALPVWYHLVFLASLIPMAMAGANLITRRRNTDQIT